MTSPEPSASSADRRRVIRDGLGVGLAVGTYGIAFGAASVTAGFTPAQTSVSSLLTFTGGTQFAIAGVIAGGGTAASALAGGFLLGARNTLYALRLRPLLQVRGLRRVLAAQGTIDESTAMALGAVDGAGRSVPGLSRLGFWTTAAAVYVMWNLATLLGAYGASSVGDPRRFGLDAVVPAAFLALLAPRLRESGLNRGIAIFAAVIALVLIPLTPPGVPVLAAAAALILSADVQLLRRRRPGPSPKQRPE